MKGWISFQPISVLEYFLCKVCGSIACLVSRRTAVVKWSLYNGPGEYLHIYWRTKTGNKVRTTTWQWNKRWKKKNTQIVFKEYHLISLLDSLIWFIVVLLIIKYLKTTNPLHRIRPNTLHYTGRYVSYVLFLASKFRRSDMVRMHMDRLDLKHKQ